MKNLRNSFSKVKKDIKHQIRGRKSKGDKPGAGEGEGSAGSPSSLPQPDPHVPTDGRREQGGGEPKAENENVGAGAAKKEKRPDWKATASSSARLILCGVRDSADAFGPLKSVAGGLYFILDNCEVRYLLS